MAGHKAMKQTLLDEFEIKGIWWIPNSEIEVSGILFYKHDRITLELIGRISEDELFDDSRRYGTLYGFSDKGEKFSLFNLVLSSSEFSAPGFTTQSFIVTEFIVGGHFENKNDINFHSMVVFHSYLADWLQRKHYSKKYITEDNSTYLKSIEWNDAENFKVFIEEQNFLIEEVDVPEGKADFQYFNWTNKAGLKITPNDTKDLDWYKQKINAIRSLLTTLINQPIYETCVIYYGDFDTTWDEEENKRRYRYMHFRTVRKMKLKDKFNPMSALIKFDDIEGNINVIMNNWFKFHQNYKVVLELYSDEFYKPMYLNSSFLSYIQSLEIYHRRKFDSKLFLESDYNSYMEKLIGFVEKEIPEFTAKIEAMKQHGNEVNLGKRLKEIINSLSKESKLYLIGNSRNRDKFIMQLVDSRNYLTHFDKSGKKNILEETNSLLHAIMRMQAIITLIILVDLGIDEEIVLERIKESPKLSGYIRNAKKVLN